jgi:hypothetical protein
MDDDTKALRAAADKRKQLAQEQLESDIRWLLADPRGRRLVTGWLAFCGVDRVSFGATDRDTSFREGARNVGLMLKAQMTEHDIDGYLLLLRENSGALTDKV